MEFEYWNLRPGALLSLSLHLYNEQGTLVFNVGPTLRSAWQGNPCLLVCSVTSVLSPEIF